MTASPYVGLGAFTEEDSPFYFGRETDARVLVTNFWGSRTTVVHGRSGVGKTSLIRAAVIPRLRAQRVNVLTFQEWHTSDLTGVFRRHIVETFPIADEPQDSPLAEVFRNRSRHLPMLIVLEHFEEFFIYHDVNEQAGGEFALAIGDVVSDSQAPAHFFFVLREDALGRLRALQSVIPSVLRNVIAIEDLPREAVSEVITRPLEYFNQTNGTSYGIEPELVHAITTEVSSAKVTQSGSVRDRVNLPLLQLVMHRIWEIERLSGGQLLRWATLKAAGGVRGLFEHGVLTTIGALPDNDQALIATLVDYLVTPSGVRIAQTEADLASLARRPVQDMQRVLDMMVRQRIVTMSEAAGEGGGRSYRVSYDEVAAALMNWRRHFVSRQVESEREHLRERAQIALYREARARRFAVSLVLISVIGVVLAGLTAYRAGLQQRAEAAVSKRIVEAATETSRGWRLLQQNQLAEALRHCSAAISIYTELGIADLAADAEQCRAQAQPTVTGTTSR